MKWHQPCDRKHSQTLWTDTLLSGRTCQLRTENMDRCSTKKILLRCLVHQARYKEGRSVNCHIVQNSRMLRPYDIHEILDKKCGIFDGEGAAMRGGWSPHVPSIRETKNISLKYLLCMFCRLLHKVKQMSCKLITCCIAIWNIFELVIPVFVKLLYVNNMLIVIEIWTQMYLEIIHKQHTN
jgi:hypothetical protein